MASLTGVGSRDTCVSKNDRYYHKRIGLEGKHEEVKGRTERMRLLKLLPSGDHSTSV